jgi:hypothetical protein
MSNFESTMHEMRNRAVVDFHITIKEDTGRHIPYAMLRKDYDKALKKWMRKDRMKYNLGLVGDTISTIDLITAIITGFGDIVTKKYYK